MSTTHYKFLAERGPVKRASTVSIWVLIVVVVAAFMALTFGDASGAGLF